MAFRYWGKNPNYSYSSQQWKRYGQFYANDFIVKYDPAVDNQEVLTEKIFYYVFIRNRIKAKKPMVIFISGDSGEGKSISGGLALQILFLKLQHNLKLDDYLDDINVYVPTEYPQKLDALLFNKRLKKVNLICMHEAREIIRAKQWRSFLVQAVGDVNAMSRSIKRMGILIISQFIRDISSDMRYTLNFYVKIKRAYGQQAQMSVDILYKDDMELEHPLLKKRKLRGILIFPDGTRRKFHPQYVNINLPPKELVDRFEKADREAKIRILKSKMDRLLDSMGKELQLYSKVELMLKNYTTDMEKLNLVVEKKGKKWKLRKEFIEIHNLTPNDVVDFNKGVNEYINKNPVFSREQMEEFKPHSDDKLPYYDVDSIGNDNPKVEESDDDEDDSEDVTPNVDDEIDEEE